MAGKYWSARAWRLHLTLLVLLPAFAVLFIWQLRRALGGNGLSWAYTVEWPLFTAYAVFLWWRLLHEDLPGGLAPSRAPRRKKGASDEELAAYNAYLASLRDEPERPSANPPEASPGAR